MNVECVRETTQGISTLYANGHELLKTKQSAKNYFFVSKNKIKRI